MELTVEQVKMELRQLIVQNPYNTGSIDTALEEEYGEKTCVYFLDQDGEAFNQVYGEDFPAGDSRQFVTPVCIVGHWVHNFHPELKNDEGIRHMLASNAIVATADYIKPTLPDDVVALLASAQYQQDSTGRTWKDIDLNELRRY